jgi:hypothetical protein
VLASRSRDCPQCGASRSLWSTGAAERSGKGQRPPARRGLRCRSRASSTASCFHLKGSPARLEPDCVWTGGSPAAAAETAVGTVTNCTSPRSRAEDTAAVSRGSRTSKASSPSAQKNFEYEQSAGRASQGLVMFRFLRRWPDESAPRVEPSFEVVDPMYASTGARPPAAPCR